MMQLAHLPIGIFDSGVGGLTVVAAIRRLLPQEPLIYLGDTARLPYGTKSAHVVQRYAMSCAKFLQGQGIKMLVVACNTASAHALQHLQQNLNIPVIGVITPSAQAAVAQSRSQCVGVIATEGTIDSGSYQQALAVLAPRAKVLTAACPLFVPLVEEGLLTHPASYLLAQTYLEPLLQGNIDTLVLGCTHYPLLTPLLQQLCGKEVVVVDSATAVAHVIQQELINHHLMKSTSRHEEHMNNIPKLYATDVNQRLQRVGCAFLGENIEHVELVDLAY